MSDALSGDIIGPSTLQHPGRGLCRVVDTALLNILSGSAAHKLNGRLSVTLPSGRRALLGHGPGLEVSLTINTYAVIWKVMRRGQLGFAEAYLSGEVEIANLRDLFRFYLDNEVAITAALPQLLRSAVRDLMFHASRRNTRWGSRRNIAAHYDLGNAFYRLWLDAGMSYSSGIYARPDMSLEQAQATKQARVVQILELEPGHRVLEIGCGWGALAEEIAARVAHVTAITISEQQHRATTERLASSLHADGVNVLFQDYRDIEGRFDRIVSIEMIEAVGEDGWATYFRTLYDHLNKGGLAVIQAITIREDLFDDYRRRPDFIQRYIFPGGMLPTVPVMRARAEQVGFEFCEIERFGASYALTVAEWRSRFIEAWPRIQSQGFDQRFRRMWEYYLSYCEVGFQSGTIDVGLYRLRKA